MPTIDLHKKMVLITGATAGIGKSAALELARMGAQVVITGRNPQKSEAVAHEIRRLADNPKIDYLIADLSIQAEVRRLAREYRRRYDRLHVLINNAAALFMERQVSAEGLEMNLALNYLAYFTLTHDLLDLLKTSAPARVINVTSSVHRIARLDLDSLAQEKGYFWLLVYARTKLMNVVFTNELARRLAGSGVTVNCMHPGLVSSDLGSNSNGIMRWAFDAYHRVALRPEKGAETIVYLASAAEVEGVTGKYFVRKTAVPPSKSSNDPEVGRKLWEFSLALSQSDGTSP